MKEYKFKINGNQYEVAINSIEGNIADVTVNGTPYKVEMELMKHIPEEQIPLAHHWLLLHGRYVCTSQRPKCQKCELSDICPKLLEGSKLE